MGAKEGVDVLPLFSRGIIVKVFANVFFKIGKPQRHVLAAAFVAETSPGSYCLTLQTINDLPPIQRGRGTGLSV